MYDKSFQAKVVPILQTAFESAFSSIYDGRVFHLIQVGNVFPALVYQSGDKGGKRTDYIDANGWTGLYILRSMDMDGENAFNLLIEAADALSSLSYTGYTIKAIPEHPQEFSIEHTTEGGNLYTAGLLINISIYKT